MRRYLIAILAGGLLLASPARANLITNGSFEAGPTGPFSFLSRPVGDVSMPGWTVINESLAIGEVPNFHGLTASDGSRFLDLTDFNDSAPHGGVRQTVATVIGGSYTLTFDLGTRPGDAAFTGPVTVNASVTGAPTTPYTTTTLVGNGAVTVWETFTLTFTATAALTIVDLIGISGINFIGLDNVILEGPVPAQAPVPGSIALLSLGLAGFAYARRRLGKG